MAVVVAVTDSEEGRIALGTACAEARLRGTDLIVANLMLRPLDLSGIPGGIGTIDTKVLERRPNTEVADHVLQVVDE